MNPRDTRPSPDDHVSLFARYIERVPDGDVIDTLRTQIEATARRLESVPASLEDHAYAPGKWTVKEVAGHVIDVER
ncbi:MAG: DinB family protein, partial [Longimicrobiales bacterium]